MLMRARIMEAVRREIRRRRQYLFLFVITFRDRFWVWDSNGRQADGGGVVA
jgi:hypothetical protein